MLKKIIIALLLVLSATLIFAGCDKVEQVGESIEDAVENRIDPIEDAIESKFDPIEDAVESKFDPIEDAVESKFDPIEDAVESKFDPIEDAVESKMDVVEDAIEKNADVIEDAVESQLNSFLNGMLDTTDHSGSRHNEYQIEDTSKNTAKDTSTKGDITKEDAKTIALEHAGVAAEEVRYVDIQIDADNGIWLYEVSFYVDGIEYEYEIHAKTGEILSFEKDR